MMQIGRLPILDLNALHTIGQKPPQLFPGVRNSRVSSFPNNFLKRRLGA
jgi:hypothetical protein